MNETAENLMNAAENRIRLRGYHAVSFRDLAKELGIKSSSVHYYFQQKEDMGLAVVKRYSDNFFSALRTAVELADASESRLETYCKVYRQELIDSDRICLCGMLGAESCGLPITLANAVAQFFKANIEWVTEAMPLTMSKQERRDRATHIVAALQGAMMLSGSLADTRIFDAAVRDLLVVRSR